MQDEPIDLDDLVEVYRPLPVWLGWMILLSVPAILGFSTAIVGLLAGVLAFAIMGVAIVVALAGVFLLEHRFYRHGVLFRTLLPFTKSYVVPYDTIDPSTIRQVGRSTHQAPQIYDGPSSRFRACWGQRNIAFIALDEHSARHLARNKLPSGRLSLVRQWWVFSTREPDHHLELLRRLITEQDEVTTRE